MSVVPGALNSSTSPASRPLESRSRRTWTRTSSLEAPGDDVAVHAVRLPTRLHPVQRVRPRAPRPTLIGFHGDINRTRTIGARITYLVGWKRAPMPQKPASGGLQRRRRRATRSMASPPLLLPRSPWSMSFNADSTVSVLGGLPKAPILIEVLKQKKLFSNLDRVDQKMYGRWTGGSQNKWTTWGLLWHPQGSKAGRSPFTAAF